MDFALTGPTRTPGTISQSFTGPDGAVDDMSSSDKQQRSIQHHTLYVGGVMPF